MVCGTQALLHSRAHTCTHLHTSSVLIWNRFVLSCFEEFTTQKLKQHRKKKLESSSLPVSISWDVLRKQMKDELVFLRAIATVQV